MNPADVALDPCPFCGRQADFEHLENTRWSVGCIDTDGECPGFMLYRTYPRKADAAKAWNTRTALRGVAEEAHTAGVMAGLEAAAKAIIAEHRPTKPEAEWTRRDGTRAHYASKGASVIRASILSKLRKVQIARPPQPSPTARRIEVKPTTPHWPAMMRRATAAAYLDISERSFIGEIAAGRLPSGIILGGREHWRKDAIDAAIENLNVQQVPEHIRRFEERIAMQRGGKAA
jgi:hypothetical protein